MDGKGCTGQNQYGSPIVIKVHIYLSIYLFIYFIYLKPGKSHLFTLGIFIAQC